MPKPASPESFSLRVDWRHRGQLDPLPPRPAPSAFLIVPLLPPSLTPGSGFDTPAILRLEVSHGAGSTTPLLDLRIDETGVQKRVFLWARPAGGGAWQPLGARGSWTVPGPAPGEALEVGLAALPGTGAERGSLGNDFTLSVGIANSPGEPRRPVRCRIAPILLTSSLDPVEEVLVVRSSLSKGFVAEMERLLITVPGRPRLRPMEFEEIPHDVWMQDTVEIGRSPIPGPEGTIRQTVTPLLGLRAKHDGIKTAPLDAFVADHLIRSLPDAVCVAPAAPRPSTRWIDWYGNLEVSPPVKEFPCGRILTGHQKELGIHPDLMAFLEAQRVQWPPLILDVSWLTIGHVDELINFVPAKGRPGFRAVLPSPGLARTLLEQAVKAGHGDAPVFAGKGKSETTAGDLLKNVARTPETDAIERALGEARARIKEGLGIGDREIVALPALYQDGLAVIPSGVNSLVVGTHVFIPDPVGPVADGEDIFRRATRQALAPLGLTLHFMDIWEPYHVRSGEIHCGTNAIRRLANPFWWKAKRGMA
ncbi:MAG: hypothetical protein H7Z41_01595 [Cytophagales bacterium]|nr:hypothetical protein [Armatimonadota bacterium]